MVATMSKSRCKNAHEVLPPQLVEEIQRHYSGLLWIPTGSTFFENRNQLIRELHANGERTGNIAKIVNLTKERVRQIVKTGTQK